MIQNNPALTCKVPTRYTYLRLGPQLREWPCSFYRLYCLRFLENAMAAMSIKNEAIKPTVNFDGEDFTVDKSAVEAKLIKSKRESKLTSCIALAAVSSSLYYLHRVSPALARKVGIGVVALPFFTIGGFTGLSYTIGKPFTARMMRIFIKKMKKVDEMFFDVRSELLKGLKGDVLDVGCGEGSYLNYYGTHADKIKNLVLLEPNKHLHIQLQDNVDACRRDYPKFKDVKVTVTGNFLKDFPASDNGRFDWVILGNVLCEVPDQAEALKQVDRLLKPGGRVFFSEHVACQPKTWARLVQELLAPWWLKVSDGCHITRCTLDAIQAQQGWSSIHYSFGMSRLLPFEVGLAAKAKASS
eukprot:g69069.t1